MKRPSAALTAKWEARLRSEGMPPDPITSDRQSMSEPHDRTTDGLSTSSTYQYWTQMTHAVHALPRNYKGRAFLVSYVECGFLVKACADVGISRSVGRTILGKFVERCDRMKGQNDQA